MLKPTKLSKKEKDNAIDASPKRGGQSSSDAPTRVFNVKKEARPYTPQESPVPYLQTKKAKMLETSADKNRSTVKTSARPAEKSKIKGLMDKAMSRYKKTEKIGMGGRSVSKEKGMFTRDVDGKAQMVREKSKTVKRGDGTVKKTVTKGKGVMGSNIGRYKDVKRYK